MKRKLLTKLIFSGILISSLGFTSCTSLSPELITALGQDDASFCATTDIRGGVGSLLNPAGGYGQATLSLCRSNKDNAELSIGPDGTLSIKNGVSGEVK